MPGRSSNGSEIRSSQYPGRNRVNATSSSSSDSQMRLRAKKKPWVADANSIIAATAITNTKIPFQTVTSIRSSSVLNRNRNGSTAVRMSYMNPCTPVLIGSPPEIAAAANAARPTGGVSSARIPK